MKNDFSVRYPDYEIEFQSQTGGFPTRILQLLRGNNMEAPVNEEKPWLMMYLADGRIAYPYLPQEVEPHRRKLEDGTTLIQFVGIPWRTDEEEVPGWKLDIEYELHSDGVGFICVSLVNDDMVKPDLKDLRLTIPMDFGPDQDTLYGYWLRPKEVDGGAIQAYSKSIFNELSEKKDILVENAIVPVITFDFGQGEYLKRHIEWFVEEQNAITELDPENTSTSISWTQNGPVLSYSFAARGAKSEVWPYVWANTFGFVITQTPKQRAKAPLRMYHYLDFEQRYPSDQQIESMAAEGADLLCLHEIWRKNMRNGGGAADEKEFMRVIATCHRYGMKVAPYIRGSEESSQENQCRWFNWYLKKDYDGLYVDYGGPHAYLQIDGMYPGGRFGFRRHYSFISALRKTVGKEGILILHQGPYFCGSVIASLVDGFCSGECEKGKMIESIASHAYYAKTTMAPGSLWTAAFPSYRTKKINPYAALTGQYPHVSLGVQVPSSSLSAPCDPGNVTFMRPIWKYFGLLQDEKNISFTNCVCDSRFTCDSTKTGISEYQTEDGALLILIENFADEKRMCKVSLQAQAQVRKTHAGGGQGYAGVSPAGVGQNSVTAGPDKRESIQCVLLEADENSTVVTEYICGADIALPMDAYGVTGILYYPDNTKWRQKIAAFAKAYPAKTDAAAAYEDKIEKMKDLRFRTKTMRQVYMRIFMPFCNPSWEKPVWDDLYETTKYVLYAKTEGGEKKRLGYLSKAGLTQESRSEDALWPMQCSPWIALHELVGKGHVDFEVHAYRVDEDYYSLVEVQLAEKMDEAPVTLTYYGEIDEDRSRLTFACDIIGD